jgi:hypothetical protein
MNDDNIRVTIEGDEPSTPRGGRSDKTDTYVPSLETRRAYAERSSALNELRDAKIYENASRQQLLITKADAEQAAAKVAWENGEIDQMQTHQRNAAAFDAKRIQTEAERRRLEAMPYLPKDPIETFISGRDAATQAWLRNHMDDALVLATGSVPAAGLQAQCGRLRCGCRRLRAWIEGLFLPRRKILGHAHR